MKTIIALILAAFAHSGGTDSQGCHVDHRTGVRHCH
ncbi:MAG: YHYH domain-containing protein [Acidovorax sp.]